MCVFVFVLPFLDKHMLTIHTLQRPAFFHLLFPRDHTIIVYKNSLLGSAFLSGRDYCTMHVM